MGSSFGFAPVITRIALTAGDPSSTVFNGAIIRVWGFIVSNAGGNRIATISTNEASPTIIRRIFLGSGQTFVSYMPFIADKGLQVSIDFGAIQFTFFHSQVGS